MPIAIKMPALSPAMEEGTLAKWLVKVGDEVSAGDIMAEIETDKATMEFEAVDEGVIAHIAVDEGTEGVKVGVKLNGYQTVGDDAVPVFSEIYTPAFTGTTDWKKVELTVPGLAYGQSATVVASIPAGSGTVYFDDFYLGMADQSKQNLLANPGFEAGGSAEAESRVGVVLRRPGATRGCGRRHQLDVQRPPAAHPRPTHRYDDPVG